MRPCALVGIAIVVGACAKPKPTDDAPSAPPNATTSTSATPTTSAAPSIDVFAQPSTAASASADTTAPYLQKPMVKISHVEAMQIDTRSDKTQYVRVPLHLEVLANGPKKAAVFGRARCRIGDENMVDDGYRFDQLDRLAPGESMALFADFFAYPETKQVPQKCTVVFSYHPTGRYDREPRSLVAAFCVDTERAIDGECKE